MIRDEDEGRRFKESSFLHLVDEPRDLHILRQERFADRFGSRSGHMGRVVGTVKPGSDQPWMQERILDGQPLQNLIDLRLLEGSRRKFLRFTRARPR